MRREPYFFVLYSARHHRCGQFIERADYRVLSKQDLLSWSSNLSVDGTVNALSLHCAACSEDFSPTHLRILEDIDPSARTIVPEIEIKKFNPHDWILKRP